MNRRSLTLLIMAAVVALLLLVYLIAVPLASRGNQNPEDSGTETAMAADFSYKNVVSISYTYEGQALSFCYKNDNWYYQEDETFPVNQTALAQMANAISSMPAQREIASSELDLALVGLEHPAYCIQVGYKSGDTYEYRFGDENSFNASRYLIVTGREDIVYMVDASVTNYFDFNLYALAQYDTYPSLASGDVTAYTITYPDGTMREITDQTLLDSVAKVAFAGCVGYKPTEEQRIAAGLDNAQAAVLTVKYNVVKEVTNDSDSVSNSANITVEYTMTLRIGHALSEDRSTYSYLMFNDSDLVYLSETSLLDQLTQQNQE